MHRIPLLAAVTVLVAAGWPSSPLAAQVPAATSGADIITAAEIARHVGVIADDSMLGRDTPSRGLELTAQYVAREFQKLGLMTFNDIINPGTAQDRDWKDWIQRFELIGGLAPNYASSSLGFIAALRRGDAPIINEEGKPVQRDASVSFGDAARFAGDTLPASGGACSRAGTMGVVQLGAVVVAGPHTLESLRRANLHDNKLVLYVPPTGIDSTLERQAVDLLDASNCVIVLKDEDSATFAARRQAAAARPVVVVDRQLEQAFGVHHWAVYVHPDAVANLFATAGLDLQEMRGARAPLVRELPALGATLGVGTRQAAETVTAPNVLGIIEGSDSGDAYRNLYVVFLAHMDGPGVRSGARDSINNGAVDNASGVAGLIELARAYSQAGRRPRRSLVFLALGGGTKNFAGAYAATNQFSGERVSGPTIVATVNLDMIGRPAGDSVVVDGLYDFDFATRPDWVAAQHPELGVTVVDGGSIATAESDHVAFVLSGSPSFYFHVGTHETAPRGRESPSAVDAAQEARILRLIYYVGQSLADADRGPSWTPSARQSRQMLRRMLRGE